MQTIISIDVGIVKLAFALFKRLEGTHEFILDEWCVVNLTRDSVIETPIACSECCKKATCTKNSVLFCAKHGKKSGGLLPSSELKLSIINKLKKELVMELMTKLGLNLPVNSNSSKQDLVKTVKEHIDKNMLQPLAKTNASKLDLNIIGRNIKRNFDAIFAGDTCHVDEVIIENQIGPQAIRMKTIQGMLSQYFIMRHDNVSIKFVNASNKLKCNAPLTLGEVVETTYKDRKDMGIHMCKHIIQTNELYKADWLEFVNSKKKVTGIADLSDCFLQGLWYIDTAYLKK
jgi:hypothetical protein